MLFMSIYTFKADKRDEIIKRRLEKGRQAPEGVKVIGEWTYLGGHKGFIVFEADNPTVEWSMAWDDLMDIEILPIADTEKDVMSLLS